MQEGFQFLHGEGLAIPEYKIILGQIHRCSDKRCYLNKLNLLPAYDPTTYISNTVSLAPSFVKEYMCLEHLLPRESHYLFDNSSHEIAYLYCAISLVKLKNYKFSTQSKAPLAKKLLTSKSNVSTVRFRFQNISNKIKDAYLGNYWIDKERVELLEKANQGACTTLKELKVVLTYQLEIFEKNNEEAIQLLNEIVKELFSLYSNYNLYYRSLTNEINPIDDFSLLNSRFNEVVYSHFIDISEAVRKRIGHDDPNSIFELLLKNYPNVKKYFDKYYQVESEIILALKAAPNQNNLFNQHYSYLPPIYLYLYLQNDLFPVNNVFYKQGMDSMGHSKALYKITSEEYFNLYLFFDGILDSNLYFKHEEPAVLDATIFWSKDYKSPFYSFDVCYNVASKV